jgi:hypothetical protein
MWWLLWVAVIDVVATMLLIAYLVDRRGPNGVTDRDRGRYRSMGGHETGAEPPGYLDAAGSS